MFDNKNYILENPNAFQIASTFVIGVVACNLALHVQEVTAKVNLIQLTNRVLITFSHHMLKTVSLSPVR